MSGVIAGAGAVVLNTCKQTARSAHRKHLFSGRWLQSLLYSTRIGIGTPSPREAAEPSLACALRCLHLPTLPGLGADVLLITFRVWHSVPGQSWPQFGLGTMEEGRGEEREGHDFPWEGPRACLLPGPSVQGRRPQENLALAPPGQVCRFEHRAAGEFEKASEEVLGCSRVGKQHPGLRGTWV